MSSKQLDTLRRTAVRDHGWRVEQGRGNHLKWFPPGGGPFVTTASTPSDHRAIKNILSDLRRAGLPTK